MTRVRLETQEWIKAGHTELSTQMRGEQELGELLRGILSFLANYVDARVGSIYVAGSGVALTRKGVYGLALPGDETDETDETNEALVAGETLVGQAAADGRIIVVDDVPDGYVDVRSGVGRATPRTLILVPARADDVVNGVVELGFFTPPPKSTLELLESASESVGVAIRSAQYRERQTELLEEWQAQAEELAQQQEELRAVNERLEEQTNAAELQKVSLQATETVLRKKAAELERASRYKSEFLANMSHELRTPLNSSLILAKLLIDNREGNLTEKQIKYASSIYSAGNDLLALINDILDLSKIEAGKIALHIESVRIEQLFEELESRFQPLASEKQLDLVIEIDADCPETIETDHQRLQQILTNLLSNAVKFTEEGSVRLSATPNGPGAIALSVGDSGIGIEPEQHELVFEAFQQADGTTNRRFTGTGLGLSICRELAGLLGAELSLRSEPGEGSVFTVMVPTDAAGNARVPSPSDEETLLPKPKPEPEPTTTPGTARRVRPRVEDDRDAISDAGRTILLVEDDPIFAQIVRDLAHELDFQCVIAGGAEEGLRLAQEYRPAAIVLDIGLPDGSGLTVLELLKRDASTRHIPVHIVSVHDHRRVARELGAVGYALKPVKREELAASFRALEARLARTMKSVLVVEDDTVQRDAIRQILVADDVSVVAVETAAAALEALRTTTFDCVVLDLMLPDASGFDVLEEMADDDEMFPAPPVIVYTARMLTAPEEERLRRHSRSIIIKGARSPERLLEEVTLFLHQVESELSPDSRQMLEAAREREEDFDGRRVLLVEDDVRNVFALTSMLEPRGVQVDVARNGEEALERLSEGPPVDLILMDIMMPEMDGLAATRAIRARDGRDGSNGVDSLPIIAVTAKAMPDDRQECLAAGANDYIAKPVDVDQLLSLLRVWMPR